MPTLVMLSGLPGSGKTTFRHKFLTEEFTRKQFVGDAYNEEFSVISYDDILLFFADQSKLSYDTLFDVLKNPAGAIIDLLLLQLALEKRNLIIDMTNLTQASRKRKLDKFYGYEKVSIHFPEENLPLLMERMKNREVMVPLEDMQRFSRRRQIPTLQEGFQRIYILRGAKNVY